MRRPLAMTVVPLLAFAAAIGWALVHIGRVEGRGEPELYARAVAWERSLSQPGTDSPAPFVHPSARADPLFRSWLSDVSRAFTAPGGTQMLQAKVLDDGRGASTYVYASGAMAREAGTVEFRWAREDGVWYVVPRFRDRLR